MLAAMRLSPLTVGAVASGAVVCAAALAACGSSGNAGAQRTAIRSQFLAFSTCMRSHGVPNFPDPSSGGGIQITVGAGVDPSSPAFQAAQQTCRKLLPGGGPPKPSAAREQSMVKLAACMRQHGLTSFPDPTIFAGGGPPSGNAIVIGGYEFKLGPGLDPSSPAFQRAMKACGGPGGG
jgi:hypothetical protein